MIELIKQIISNGFAGVLTSKYSITGTALFFIFIISMLLCIIIPYFLGSINFALILSKKLYNDDIRLHGSGNAGATNMMRTYGKSAAAKTFLGDGLKAFLACVVGYLFLGYLGCYLAGLFCVIGHAFPIFYKFKGGKGVVVAAISILMGNPIVFVILFVIFFIIVFGTKFVSLASMMCMLIYPLILNGVQSVLTPPIIVSGEELSGGGLEVLISFCMAVLVVFLHRENIKRLYTGTESKTNLFSKHKKDGVFEASIEQPHADHNNINPVTNKTKVNPNTSKKKIKKKSKNK